MKIIQLRRTKGHYVSEITEELKLKTGLTHKFTIDHHAIEPIFRIRYKNISIADIVCTVDTHYVYKIINTSVYMGNIDYVQGMNNTIINIIYRYLKELEEDTTILL